MTFPLKAWIDEHSELPHQLGSSGMGPTLESVRRALRRPEPGDEPALRAEFARSLGLPPRRLFLTHGATEANTLILSYLAGRRRRGPSGPPRCSVGVPEYPSLPDTARGLGYSIVASSRAHDVAIVSDPQNPSGVALSPAVLSKRQGERGALVADETYREFRGRPSIARAGRPGLWTTGTLTKVYGGDRLRVGYATAPPEEVEEFDRFYGVATDDIPWASVAGARAILRDRARILEEVRERFRANLAVLREGLDGVPELDAPVYFDRVGPVGAGDALAHRARRAGVLVCPGSFFGDSRGVRIGLTRPEFPTAFAAYLKVRARWTDRARGPNL